MYYKLNSGSRNVLLPYSPIHTFKTAWPQNPSATLSLLIHQGVLHGKELRTS
jgi:hypothetical protein